MNKITEWEYLSDTPDEFNEALKNATSDKEREFFKNIRFKILHETAFSNDVLMSDIDNNDGLFIIRSGIDDILIGINAADTSEKTMPCEYEGIFHALEQDLHRYIGRHVSLLEWLRERNYKGIRYDANNDYN